MNEFNTQIVELYKSFASAVEAQLKAPLPIVPPKPAPQPSLPQHAPDSSARQQQLGASRQDFVFSYAFAPPLPNVTTLPKEQAFTQEYSNGMAPTTVDVVANQLHALRSFFDAHPDLQPDVSLIPKLVQSWKSGPTSFLNSAFFTDTLHVLLQGKPAPEHTLDRYSLFFQSLPKPDVAPVYADDWVFGQMRVAGCNPTMLRRIEKLPDNFPVPDSLFKKVTNQEATLEAAGRDGRLYLCDYAILDDLPGGVVHGKQKYPAAPLALFCWIPGGGAEGGSLMPVAIQIGQKPSKDTPIFTPLDGIKWKIAKSFVQAADGDHHQAIAHLFQTHLRVEPAIVATHRELAAAHPLHVLLAPHFEFTLAINHDARTELLREGGVVDMLLSPSIAGSVQAIKRAYDGWRFDEMCPETSFRKRGVDDTGLLPSYPFRDDTLLLWQSIRGFVDRYVDLYYGSEQHMAADVELQAWAQCLISNDGARFAGMSIRPNEPFTDLAYLKRVCSQIIYTASAQHAAVNYAQYPLMSYSPHCPLALYGPPPTASSVEDEHTYVQRLPPVSMGLWQLAVAKLLSSQQRTQLCRYGNGTFADPRVAPLVADVQAELARAEATIVQRNKGRRLPYELQLPSKVPNSILI